MSQLLLTLLVLRKHGKHLESVLCMHCYSWFKILLVLDLIPPMKHTNMGWEKLKENTILLILGKYAKYLLSKVIKVRNVLKFSPQLA